MRCLRRKKQEKKYGYLSWAANMLRSGPKVWHLNKRDFFQPNCLDSDQ